MVSFSCTRSTFVPVDTHRVQWLQKDVDYGLARDYWQNSRSPLTHPTWIMAHSIGYQYAAILDQEQVISLAGVWRFSDSAWDVAAVSTLEPFQRQGFAKQVVSFVTAYILDANHLATCSTGDTNLAMIATARSVGFQQISPEDVGWTYPQFQ